MEAFVKLIIDVRRTNGSEAPSTFSSQCNADGRNPEASLNVQDSFLSQLPLKQQNCS